MKKIKVFVVGLSLLSLAGVSFAATKEEELAALKASYTQKFYDAKTTYEAAKAPLSTQVADLTSQKKSLTEQKKAAMETRKATLAALRDEVKSRKDSECKAPKAQAKVDLKAYYDQMVTYYKQQYPPTTAPDGTEMANPLYTQVLGNLLFYKESENNRIAAKFEKCVNNLNTYRQAKTNEATAPINDLNGQIETLDTSISQAREQLSQLKESYSTQKEQINAEYEAAKQEIETKYTEAPASSEPAPAPSEPTVSTSTTTTVVNTESVYCKPIEPVQQWGENLCGYTKACSDGSKARGTADCSLLGQWVY